MKTAITILMICFFLNASAQETTQEEYNYMTKGYVTQIEQGLDMKKGYYIGATWTDEGWVNYKVYFLELRRDDKSLAGTIIAGYSITSGKVYYYGLPNSSTSTYMDKFRESLWELDGSMTDVMLISFAKYIARKIK